MCIPLDRVVRPCTQILGLDGEGGADLYADCEQWEQDLARKRGEARRSRPAGAAPPIKAPTPRKLSYLETREFEQIETRILEAEQALEFAQRELQNPEGAADPAVVRSRWEATLRAQADVDRLYARWAELEAKLAG